jgi:hypothetical protein
MSESKQANNPIDFSLRKSFVPPPREELEREAAKYSGHNEDAFAQFGLLNESQESEA